MLNVSDIQQTFDWFEKLDGHVFRISRGIGHEEP